MIESNYRWVVDLVKMSGDSVGQVEIEIDLAPISEYVFLEGVRCNSLPRVKNNGKTQIEPIWDAKTKQPYVSGIKVTVNSNGSSYTHSINTVANGIFREPVRRVSTELVKKGKLVSGEEFNYHIIAFPRAQAHDGSNDYVLKAIDEPLNINDSITLQHCLNHAQRHGETAWDNNDYPVFIPDSVLVDVRELGKKAGEAESGGILLGHLCHEEDKLFSIVTAFIEAKHTQAKSTSLTFTAETWADVNNALSLRQRGEQILGWAHSHPAFAWCKGCDDVRRRICPMQKPFFSDSDVNVHRTVFPSAFMTAILFSIFSKQTAIDAYGWRNGQVKARGYYVVNGNIEFE